MKKKLIIFILFPVVLCSQNKLIFDLQIGDYDNIKKNIQNVNSEILQLKLLMKNSIIEKSNLIQPKTPFETDEDYIKRVVEQNYLGSVNKSKFVFYLEKLNELKARRTYYKNFVFVSENLQLNLIDSNYNANDGTWMVDGYYNLSDFQNLEDTIKINNFKLNIDRVTAKYLYENKSQLNYKGVFTSKYGSIRLIGLQIILSNDDLSSDFSDSRILMTHKFDNFDEQKIILPRFSTSSLINSRDSMMRETTIEYFDSEIDDIKFLKLSNHNKVLAYGSTNRLSLFFLDSNKHFDLILAEEVSVEKRKRSKYDDSMYYYSYIQSNIDDLNFSSNFKEKNKKSVLEIKDVEFSPNDSLLIISFNKYDVKRTVDKGMNRVFDNHYIFSYNVRNKAFHEVTKNINVSDRDEYLNITFPFQENDNFYVIKRGSDEILKFNLVNYNSLSYNTSHLHPQDFMISYDNSFLLVNGEYGNDLLFDINKNSYYKNYSLPANYYVMFPNYKNSYEYDLPFDINSNKNYDIRCPKCTYNYLKLTDKNIFECNSCSNLKYVLINEKFYEYDNATSSLSLNYKDLFVQTEWRGFNLIFSTDHACRYKYGYLDKCGDCVGGATGKEPCKKDCNGIYGGKAFLDNCKKCVGGATGILPNLDIDSCGVCFGDNSSCKDCFGIINGLAYIDNCGDCVGGTTNKVECIQDCYGTYGGTAIYDECGNCVYGKSILMPCEIIYKKDKIISISQESIDGHLVYKETRYDNGIIKSKVSFKQDDRYEKYFNRKGELHGLIRYFYENGQLQSEIEYFNGKIKVKTHFKFHLNGVVSHKINMYGKYGIIKEFDSNGRRIDRYKCDRYGNRIDY
tara:strand:- start:2355 stop:4895 length:2541 start_codon:yes stop_codon:yes gene_type:complete